MFPYIFTYFFISFIALFENQIINKKIYDKIFYFLIAYLIIFSGYKFNIGGDWNFYLTSFFVFPDKFENNILSYIYFIAYKTKISFQNTHLFISSIFFFYFAYLIKDYKNKIFILSFSFPLLILIVHLGFTKQSLAIIFFINSINEYKKGKYTHSLILLILGMISHYSLIIFTFFFFNKNFFKNKYSIILIIISIIFLVLNFQTIYSKVYYWIFDYEFASSKGAYLRVTLISLISIFLFYFRKTYVHSESETYILYYLTATSILFLILIIFFPNFTLVDRLNYYLLPFQYIFIDKFIESRKLNIQKIQKLFIIILNFLILVTWLLFANHNNYWIPYNNYLLIDFFNF